MPLPAYSRITEHCKSRSLSLSLPCPLLYPSEFSDSPPLATPLSLPINSLYHHPFVFHISIPGHKLCFYLQTQENITKLKVFNTFFATKSQKCQQSYQAVKKLGDHRYRQHQHQISLEGHHLKSKSTCHVHVVTQQTLSFVTTTTTISLSLVTSVSLAAVTGLTVALSETSLLVVALGKMLKGHVLQLPPLRVLLSTTTLITYRCLLPQ